MKISEGFEVIDNGDMLQFDGIDVFNTFRGITFSQDVDSLQAKKLRDYLTRWLERRDQRIAKRKGKAK
jgi:hypothetical protein